MARRNGLVVFGVVAVAGAAFGFPFFMSMTRRDRPLLMHDGPLPPSATIRGQYSYAPASDMVAATTSPRSCSLGILSSLTARAYARDHGFDRRTHHE